MELRLPALRLASAARAAGGTSDEGCPSRGSVAVGNGAAFKALNGSEN